MGKGMYTSKGFSGYEMCLLNSGSDDYWADCGILDAISVLENFTEADWEELATTWMDQSTDWRNRCAQTLGSCPSERVGSILLTMLGDSDGEVVVEAVGSLQCLDFESLAISSDDVARLLAAYDRVHESNRCYFRAVCRGLLLAWLRDDDDEAVVKAVEILESMKFMKIDELSGDVARLLAVHDKLEPLLEPLGGIVLRAFLQMLPVQGNPWSTVRP